MAFDSENNYLESLDSQGICRYLGDKIRRGRKARGESQAAFASRAGIALRTFKRLEAEGAGNLDTFIRALVALDRVLALRVLFPQQAQPRKPTPMERIDALVQARKIDSQN